MAESEEDRILRQELEADRDSIMDDMRQTIHQIDRFARRVEIELGAQDPRAQAWYSAMYLFAFSISIAKGRGAAFDPGLRQFILYYFRKAQGAIESFLRNPQANRSLGDELDGDKGQVFVSIAEAAQRMETFANRVASEFGEDDVRARALRSSFFMTGLSFSMARCNGDKLAFDPKFREFTLSDFEHVQRESERFLREYAAASPVGRAVDSLLGDFNSGSG